VTRRGVIAAILAVLSGVLAPVGAISAWAWTQVSDTDRFVATFAPLAQAPAVQQLVVSRVSKAAVKKLGVIGQYEITQSVVDDTVTAVVSSPAFAAIWAQTLRSSHRQLHALLADEQGALEIEDNTLQMPLGPYAEAIKQRLIAAGIPFADRLPTVTTTVPLIELDPRIVALARGGYRGLEAMATWLPWLALLCGVAAFLVWPNKRRALIIVGVAVGVGAAAVAITGAVALPTLSAGFAADVWAVVALFLVTATGPLISPLLGLGVTATVLLFTGALAVKPPAAT
jgi:hypothetical protein